VGKESEHTKHTNSEHTQTLLKHAMKYILVTF